MAITSLLAPRTEKGSDNFECKPCKFCTVKITGDLFNAYLHCPTKCWLRSGGEPRGTSSWADWVQSNGLIYRSEGIKQLVGDIPSARSGITKELESGWLVIRCRCHRPGVFALELLHTRVVN